MKTPAIFAYLDYRNFFPDAFKVWKPENSKASFRSIAKMAGYSSPNFLQIVIAGKGNWISERH